ncbi:hypothetical protein BYT27DRAFT_7190726 [Phlegmacium glaucopus]|nr:hypothetical protein BYT27DRAFT_7190726 [Phlegmacium glaucopus]
MVTDTKSVWTEVLNSKQMARRWRDCNPASPEPFNVSDDEDLWRDKTLELLSKAHTIGGIADFTLEAIESNYSDLALELECESFKWRWETCFSGYRRSSEIISRHLIVPLISMNHLTFSSSDAVGEMPDVEVERAVDKVGRTARRTVDTHIKNALSKPRVATTMRRMTAMFNFLPDLPPVSSTDEKPDLRVEPTAVQKGVERPLPREHIEIKRNITPKYTSEMERNHNAEVKPIEPDSATESDADEPTDRKLGKSIASSAGLSKQDENKMDDRPTSNTPAPVPAKAKFEPSSSSESSPHRPTKRSKPKISSSSDEASEADNKPHTTGTSSGGTRRGAAPRQPIKRGGKRF